MLLLFCIWTKDPSCRSTKKKEAAKLAIDKTGPGPGPRKLRTTAIATKTPTPNWPCCDFFSIFLAGAFHFNYFSNVAVAAASAAGNDMKFTYAISLLPQDLAVLFRPTSLPSALCQSHSITHFIFKFFRCSLATRTLQILFAVCWPCPHNIYIYFFFHPFFLVFGPRIVSSGLLMCVCNNQLQVAS